MSSIGVPKGKSQVLMIKRILECRVVVARYLDADLHSDTTITEVSQSIMEMWAKRAGDPDTPVVRWLREGAPAGITKHPENVGVFPEDSPAPSYEFDFTHHSETFVNYVSMDESLYGEEILAHLVSSNYVKEFKSMKDAKNYLGGVEPVLTKMVLITTM